MQEIYNVLQRIDHNNVIFFCVFIDDEPLTFEKAYQKLNERKQ